jgi:hypothetical protein
VVTSVPVQVAIGNLGPYRAELFPVREDVTTNIFADEFPPPPRTRWRADVNGAPYADEERLMALATSLDQPAEVTLTAESWPRSYTGWAWLCDLEYHVGPRRFDGFPMSREETLSFVLKGIGTARSLFLFC